ncbi:hypothetical protein KEM52_003482 [Ascosphaera acerosa]|nr:hypothetical protein KEM52_003482 [Ascosphaera acerosa]
MSAHLDALIRNGLAVGFRLTTNQWEELIVALTAQSGRNGGLDVAVIAALEQWRLDNRMELGILAMQCLGLVELGLLDLDEALLDLTGIKASDCAHLPLTVAASIDARIRGNVVGEKMASGEGRCNACGGAGETSSDAVSPTASHTRLAGNRDGEPQHARVQADQSEDGQDGQYRQSQMESGGLKRRRLDDGDQSGTSADRGTATEGLDVVPPAPAPTPEVEDTNQVTWY